MSEKIGRLKYNPQAGRYGIKNSDDWTVEGLHCGEIFQVYLDNKWIPDRIEFSDDWYLVFSKLKGNDLENLKVQY